MVAFCFQPQHIIANPHTLFYKTDTNEHREKLKHVFPLALGIATNETLVMRRELADLETDLERKRKQLASIKAATDVWLSEVRGHYTTARELGILTDVPEPKAEWKSEHYVSYLSRVPGLIRSRNWLESLESNTQVAVKELLDIESREGELAHEIGLLRKQLLQMQSFNATLFEYNNAIGVQKRRTEGVGWFSEAIGHAHQCPVCKSNSSSAKSAVMKILAVSRELATASQNVAKNQDAFQREIADTQKKLRESESGLQDLRKERGMLESRSAALDKSRQTLRGIYTFIGKLEQALQNYGAAGRDDGLLRKVRDLEVEVDGLRKKLDPRSERERQAAVARRITSFIQGYAGILDIEEPGNPVELDTKNLTLKITSRNGRLDLLWEIGSGANWVGYHVATLLALHQLFAARESCPVPTFLAIDQPSQVYFPAGWPDDESGKARPKLDASDIASVHKIFESLAKGIQKTGGALQVIVVEHADEITWRGIDEINVVQRWREGQDALIPSDW